MPEVLHLKYELFKYEILLYSILMPSLISKQLFFASVKGVGLLLQFPRTQAHVS